MFFQLSEDLLCVAGYDGYFKKINPIVSKTLGYTDEELFSRPINDFVFHDDKEITAKKRHRLAEGTRLLNFENRYLTKEGEIVWLSWTSIPVPELKLVFAIAKNVTYKKKLEEDRNNLTMRLLKTNDELTQLTYTTSHDLRSPVANLMAAFSMLDTSKIQDQETLEYIDLLKLTTEHLKTTLNQHMDQLISRNYQKVEVDELDFADCLNSVTSSLSSLIKSSDAHITTDFSEARIVKFNRNYLESIFLNLITNAIKYAKPDTFPEISVRSALKNGALELSVEDKGLGFDMDKVGDKLFGFHQKFHAHPDSKGIGLYLVYNHVTSMGGHITVKSKPGEGTTFTITFKS